MRTWITLGLVAGAGALGFYIGAKYALGQVRQGVDDAADSLLGKIGLNVNEGYGRDAHNLIDAFVGGKLQ